MSTTTFSTGSMLSRKKEIIIEAGKRFADNRSKIKERLTKKAEKLAVASRKGDVIDKAKLKFLERGIAILEGRIDHDDIRPASDFTKGSIAAKAVCLVKSHNEKEAWTGSGFLISDALVMTNNHVIANREEAEKGELSFNFDSLYDDDQIVTFKLLPEEFFYTNKALDVTIVAVSRSSKHSNTDLKQFGSLRFGPRTDKELLFERATVIQHPLGEEKKYSIASTIVIEANKQYLNYDADTRAGSSGSPVLDQNWLIAALHHAGVPALDETGRILNREGKVWNEEEGEDNVNWISNEGILNQGILANLQNQTWNPSEKLLLNAAGLISPDGVRNGLGTANRSSNENERTDRDADHPRSTSRSVIVPLKITVEVLDSEFSVSGDNGYTRSLERVEIDQNYRSRKGYNPKFLGSGLEVSMPTIPKYMLRDLSINSEAKAGEPEYLLPYHYFSIVMHAKRKLALFTAENVDGGYSEDIVRAGDKWIKDSRIPEDAQYDNEIYLKNYFDRGHLVRRKNPAWNSDRVSAEEGNNDTFHYTNCAPQHESFNRGKTQWLGLENYILNNAVKSEKRICVFVGPVFSSDDTLFDLNGVDVQVPSSYWKIVVWENNGNLSATGYIVEQVGFFEATRKQPLNYGKYRTFQRTIREIENRTDLDFGELRDLDPLRQRSYESSRVGRNMSSIELSSLNDMVLD